MRFTSPIAAFVASVAILPSVLGDSTSVASVCSTSYGLWPERNVRTKHHDITVSFVAEVTTTSTPITTVTPAPYTSTSTATSTVILTDTVQKTDTFTQTQRKTVTRIRTHIRPTQTSTVTTTTTTTMGSETTTIGTVSGFIPAWSAPATSMFSNSTAVTGKSNSSGGNASKKVEGKLSGRRVTKAQGKSAAKNHVMHIGAGALRASPAQYPQTVKCADQVEIFVTSTISVVGPEATVTAATPTSSTTVTSTTTLTTTTCLSDADVTVQVTKTKYNTKTIVSAPLTTTTATDIVTFSITPTSTVYAACATNNLFKSYPDGKPVNQISEGSDYTTVTTDSALDCCNLCQATTDCAASVFFGGQCTLALADTCSAGTSIGYFGYSAPPKGQKKSKRGATISNGACGYLANAGENVGRSTVTKARRMMQSLEVGGRS